MSLYEWAQGINGLTTEQIALSTLMIYRAMQGFSATGAADILNFEGMDVNDIAAYANELSKYAQTITDALKATYETLMNLKATMTDSEH